MREAAGDAVERLCFLADALGAQPDAGLEAASRRALGRMVEDIAVMLADALQGAGVAAFHGAMHNREGGGGA